MDWIGHADVFVLACMLFYVIVAVSLGSYRFFLTRYQLRSFLRDAAGALRSGALDEVIAVASRTSTSPVAQLMASGVTAFWMAPPERSRTEVIVLSRRGFERAQTANRDYLGLGIVNLRSIAATAPFVGLLGTCFGILGALSSGGSMQKDAFLRMITSRVAAALITTAMGLLVVVPSVWAHNYLQLCRERVELELSDATLEIIDQLSVRPECRRRDEYLIAAWDQGSPQPDVTADSRRQQKRFSELPAFALMAVPVLACGVVGFMTFPSRAPAGLGINLRATPVSEQHVPRVIVGRGTNGRVVIFLDSREIAPLELEGSLRNELNDRVGSTACVQGDPALSWASMATVIDTVRTVTDHVLLPKACP
jgi:biopolymer transport protein ExbB/TolQ